MSDKLNQPLYDIVDDEDQIIGRASKEKLHKEGLLHRGINVLFFRKNGLIVLQRRAANKSTFPNKLDVTVGGHVDLGDSYEQAALKEIIEETGLEIDSSNLIFIMKLRRSNEDVATKTISNYFSTIYAYNFEGDISDLRIEEGKSVGFEERALKENMEAQEDDASELCISITKQDYKPVWSEISKLMG